MTTSTKPTTKTGVLRALIVDDERPARELLRRLLTDQRIEVVGECANGKEAIAEIAKQAPTVVFLDIQMPGMNGFDVIEAVGIHRMPPVVFVTAYDQHALRAFDVNAVDYLLKPFSIQRFTRALHRLQERAKKEPRRERSNRLRRMIEHWRKPSGTIDAIHDGEWLDRVMIRDGRQLMSIPADEIDSITSADHYVNVSSKRKSYLVYESLASIESRLNPVQFVRIHRTVIVNIRAVKQVLRTEQAFKVQLKDGSEFPISRSRHSQLAALLAGI